MSPIIGERVGINFPPPSAQFRIKGKADGVKIAWLEIGMLQAIADRRDRQFVGVINARLGAMFDAIKANLRPDIPVVEVDCNINDAEFAAKAVEMMLGLIGQK